RATHTHPLARGRVSIHHVDAQACRLRRAARASGAHARCGQASATPRACLCAPPFSPLHALSVSASAPRVALWHTCERGIWYGSLALPTASAEVAYYRLIFLDASAAELGTV